MDLTAGSIPKAGILMQSSGTGLVYKSTRRRAASWGFISEILTIGEIFTIVMVSEIDAVARLWPLVHRINSTKKPTTLLYIVVDDVSVRDCRRYIPPEL